MMPSLPRPAIVTTVLMVFSLTVLRGVAQAQPADADDDPAVRDDVREDRVQSSASDAPKALVVDRVVAVVNDEVILSTELMMRVAPLAFDLQKISDPKERARRQAKLASQVLDEMVNEELVTQAATSAQLDVDAKEVEAAIADLKKQNELDDEQLAEALRMQGYNMSSYRRDVRNQILRMRAVNTLVRPRVSITEDDVKAKYDETQRRSSQVSEVKLQHILFAMPDNADEATIRETRAKAADVLARAKAGEDFATLAATYSEDSVTKNIGGDLGWIGHNMIETEWETIVFNMAAGETRGPISGPRGLHVFHVSEIKESKKEPFEDVKEKIRNELYRLEMDKQTRLWVDELRKKAHFEVTL